MKFTRPFVFVSLLLLLIGLGMNHAGWSARAANSPAWQVAAFVVTNANDSGEGSLRKAIQDANAMAGVKTTITFATPFFSTPRTITLTSGDLGINSNITINGPGANLLTVSGNNVSRVFFVSSNGTTTLNGMTMSGGNGAGQGFNGIGGGINNEGSLTVSNSILSGNTSTGGGIYNRGGTVTVINSVFTNNLGDAGGAIYNSRGTVTVTNSTFSGNRATNNGGAIYNISDGGVTVSNSTLSGNTASHDGGGIYNAAFFVLTNSTLFGNTSNNRGGGIYNEVELKVKSSTLSGNRATNNGGGINNEGLLDVVNSTIANNNGGGIHTRSALQNATTKLRNTIIAGSTPNNLSTEAGSSVVTVTSLGFNLTSDNSLQTLEFLNQSTDFVNINPLLGPLQDNGGPTPTHALLFGSRALDAGHSSDATTDQRGLSRRVDLGAINNERDSDGADIGAYEAQSAPVQPPPPTVAINDVSKNEGNSGQTAFDFTVKLSEASAQTVTVDYISGGGMATAGSDYAAIEGRLIFAPGQTTQTLTVRVNGDTTVEPDETFFINLRSPANGTIADGQGQGTILNDDVLSLIVQNTNDSGDGSLRQVIAGAPAGSTVTFSSTVFNTTRTITLTSDQLLINKNLTISGPGANLLTISGGNALRVIRVQGSGLNVTINDVTIRNGSATGSIGGGILSNGALTMNRCHVADNRATTSGGGIHLDGASGTFNACTFSGNQAANGGGIYFNGTGNGQTLSLTNCTFSGNAGTTTGGALAHAGTGGSTVTQINSCTIANNDSADGGGIYIGATGANVSAAAITRNSIYASNSNTNLRFVPANGAGATITSQGFNLTTGSGSGILSSGGDQLNTDPLLGPLQNNGGPTPTRALLAGSPAQDKGQSGNLNTDQRGNVRPYDDPALTNAAGGDGADIGAYEQDQQLFPVSAASYTTPLAMESIVAAFGINLSNGVGIAGTIPLPTTLNEASFTVRDSLGVERAAPLFFAAPGQVNFQIPPGTALGNATIIARRNGTPTAGAIMMINAAEPGLFTANSSGTGLPAGNIFRLKANGEQLFEPIAAYNAATQSFDPVPINLGPAGDRVFLILYGTGIRFHGGVSNVKVNVAGLTLDALFAGNPGGFIGLDQVNSAELPRTLAGRGQVNVTLLIGAKSSNTVTLNFK